jgi:hypothetical protein
MNQLVSDRSREEASAAKLRLRRSSRLNCTSLSENRSPLIKVAYGHLNIESETTP